MNKKDLDKNRSKSIKENQKRITDLLAKKLKEEIKFGAGKSKNANKIKELKLDISQLMTIVREKEIVENQRSIKEEKKAKK